MKFYSGMKHFHSRKCTWKCRLRNGVHLPRPQWVNKSTGLTGTWRCLVVALRQSAHSIESRVWCYFLLNLKYLLKGKFAQLHIWAYVALLYYSHGLIANIFVTQWKSLARINFHSSNNLLKLEPKTAPHPRCVVISYITYSVLESRPFLTIIWKKKEKRPNFVLQYVVLGESSVTNWLRNAPSWLSDWRPKSNWKKRKSGYRPSSETVWVTLLTIGLIFVQPLWVGLQNWFHLGTRRSIPLRV